MMELFVFLQMGSSVDDIELVYVYDNDALSTDIATFFEQMFDTFDVFEAQCFDPVQRDQLLGIIGALDLCALRERGELSPVRTSQRPASVVWQASTML